MSFSIKVKKEVCDKFGEGRHCRLAELSAMLCCSGHYDNDGSVRLQTESLYAAKAFYKIINIDYKAKCGITLKNYNQFHKKNIGKCIILTIYDSAIVKKVLNSTGVQPEGNERKASFVNRDSLLVNRDCCRKAYMRGVFLSCGSMSKLEKNNHLEMVTQFESLSTGICNVLTQLDLGLKPKTLKRKNKYVVYFKDGEQISSFLGVIGAYNAMMEFENQRIIKDVNNTINRQVNCANANMDKSINAALSQINDILLIDKKIGLSTLPENLEEMARVRLANPVLSLKEIGQLLNPPVGKSGVNHRLKKISVIANELNEKPL